MGVVNAMQFNLFANERTGVMLLDVYEYKLYHVMGRLASMRRELETNNNNTNNK